MLGPHSTDAALSRPSEKEGPPGHAYIHHLVVPEAALEELPYFSSMRISESTLKYNDFRL